MSQLYGVNLWAYRNSAMLYPFGAGESGIAFDNFEQESPHVGCQ